MAEHHSRVAKPGKHPNCPLRGHANGKWYIKRKGRFYYFGTWDDPDGAEREYDAVKHLVREGKPLDLPPDPSLITVLEVADRFLSFQESRVREGAKAVDEEGEEGEIGYGQFDDYRRVLMGPDPEAVGGFVGFVGPRAAAANVRDDKLQAYRTDLRDRFRAHTTNRHLQWVRAMFRWANVKAKLIATDQHNSYALRAVPAEQVRREQRLHEEKHGAPFFSRRAVRKMLKHLKRGGALRAMVLLALNCGYGHRDLAALRMSVVNLDEAYIRYPRRKKEILRQATLWPETVEAIREYLPHRPKPKSAKDEDVLFITRWGRRYWHREVEKLPNGGIGKVKTDDPLRKEFAKLVKRLNLQRRGRGFYALRRVFATWADQQGDRNARLRIMGQQLQGMDPHYVRLMPRKRLRKVTNFARHKILLEKLKKRPPKPGSPAGHTEADSQSASSGPSAPEPGTAHAAIP